MSREAPRTVGTSMLALAFNAPVCGFPPRGGSVVHAVDLDGLPRPKTRRTTCDAVCGKKVRISLVTQTTADGEDVKAPVLWPPRVADLRGCTRCPECFDGTPHKRPRPRKGQVVFA